MPNLNPTFGTAASSEVRDLLQTTQMNLPPKDEYAVLLKYSKYPICATWWAPGNAIMDTINGGTSFSMRVRVANNGSFRWMFPGERTDPTNVDVMQTIQAPWCTGGAYFMILDYEVRANRNKKQALINLFKTRRGACYGDIAEGIEEHAWSTPSATNARIPWSIKYYIVPITSTQVAAAASTSVAFGFQGYVDATLTTAGVTTVAGMSPTTYARWRNWNGLWTNGDGIINENDVEMISNMLLDTNIEGPELMTDGNKEDYRNLRFYTNRAILNGLSKRARSQNDQLGSNVAMYYGRPVINNIPIKYTPVLNDDTSNPLYLLNHDHMKPVVQQGALFLESEGINGGVEHHDVTVYFVDLQFNYICDNRQRVGGMVSFVE